MIVTKTKYYNKDGKELCVPFGARFAELPHTKKVYYRDDNGEMIIKEYNMVDNDGHLLDMNRRGIPNKPTVPPNITDNEGASIYPQDINTKHGTVKTESLSLNEMFISISGEVGIIPQGTLVTVLRLQKCNLSCDYCDAKDSQVNGIPEQNISITDLVKRINKANLPVLITGGEPLLQSKQLAILLNKISIRLIVQIETNGTCDFIELFSDKDCSIIMDYKFDNPPTDGRLRTLNERDYLKFVISSSNELAEAMYLIGKYNTLNCNIAISSTKLSLYPKIVKAVEKTNTKVLVNVQIHKFIGVQ